ncbi:MAG: hypothetical protein HYX39_10210 [Bacteroidetes bacterium]|nr:hypothetical protein [Bacteroidota bacterium]
MLTITSYIQLSGDSKDNTEFTKKNASDQDEIDSEDDEVNRDTDSILNNFIDFDRSEYMVETGCYNYNETYLSFSPIKTSPPPKV